MKKLKKYAMRSLLVLLALCVVLGGAGYLLMGKALISARTTKKVDDFPLYLMRFQADYALDKLLEQGGVTGDEELVQFMIRKLTGGLPIPVNYEVPDLGGCSTFTAETPQGQRLFGRNHDMAPTSALVCFTAPKGAYRSVSMVNLAFLGYSSPEMLEGFGSKRNCLAAPYFPLDGINEKGLAAAVLQIMTEPTNQNTGKPGITTTLALRLLLDKAATVEEAIALLEQYDMHASANGCYQIHVADAKGDSAVVSYDRNNMVVTRGDGTYQACTNFYLYNVDFDYIKVGVQRYETLQQVLTESRGILTAGEGMALLERVKSLNVPDESGNYIPTQWSCVYNLTEGSVTVSLGQNYEKSLTYFATGESD